MSRDRYVPISMLVELAEDCVDPHIFALTGPKDWRRDLSRKVFHETVHYWQHISQGYLLRIAEDDWRRLKHFEETREVLPAGPLKQTMLAEGQDAGFSPRDLMEAHARYCDIHAIGPPRLIESDFRNGNKVSDPDLRNEYETLKEKGMIWRERTPDGEGIGYSGLSFDIAMRLAGGTYAAPYLRLRDATSTYTAGVLFPLVAHFAMHSDEPVATYTYLVDQLQALREPNAPPPIEWEWRRMYPTVLKLALETSIAKSGSAIHPGRHVIDRGLLATHPGYHLAAAVMALATLHLRDKRPNWLLFEGMDAPMDERADWTLDFLLSCPANSAARETDMLCFLSPPWVRFGEETDWIPGLELDRLVPRMEVQPEIEGITHVRPEYRRGLAKIQRVYTEFLRAGLLSGGLV